MKSLGSLVTFLWGSLCQDLARLPRLPRLFHHRLDATTIPIAWSVSLEGFLEFRRAPSWPFTIPASSNLGERSSPSTGEEIDLAEAEKAYPCCSAIRVKIGETVCERLDYTPSSIFVRAIARPTYACRAATQQDSRN
jgi:hypothetical protein